MINVIITFCILFSAISLGVVYIIAVVPDWKKEMEEWEKEEREDRESDSFYE